MLELEDYPSIMQLRTALLAANIVPIFAVTADVRPFYESLVATFGFGSVVTLTSNSSNLVTAIIDGLETTTTITGGAIDYTLGVSSSGVNSGLIHTASNNHVFLFLEGGQVVGRSGTNAGTAASGTIVFTLSVDDAGLVTLDQRAAVRHDPDTGPDQPVSIAANLITLTGTATDGDGDSASHTLQIGASLVFEDDAPTVTVAAAADAGVTVTTQDEDTIGANTDTATANFAALFTVTPSYGADGAGTTRPATRSA